MSGRGGAGRNRQPPVRRRLPRKPSPDLGPRLSTQPSRPGGRPSEPAANHQTLWANPPGLPLEPKPLRVFPSGSAAASPNGRPQAVPDPKARPDTRFPELGPQTPSGPKPIRGHGSAVSGRSEPKPKTEALRHGNPLWSSPRFVRLPALPCGRSLAKPTPRFPLSVREPLRDRKATRPGKDASNGTGG